jgi:hypothetical protein
VDLLHLLTPLDHHPFPQETVPVKAQLDLLNKEVAAFPPPMALVTPVAQVTPEAPIKTLLGDLIKRMFLSRSLLLKIPLEDLLSRVLLTQAPSQVQAWKILGVQL